METHSIIRRLRGAVGNALVWGAGWTALGFGAFAALNVTGILPDGVSWLDSIMVAGRLGIMGGITGAAFSGVIGLLYRGRRLFQISAWRFGARGGMVAGLFVPAFLQGMNLLSGGELVPMGLILDDTVLAALFGGVAAGGSLKLAQRAQAMLPSGSRGRLGDADDVGRLGAGGLDAFRGAPARASHPVAR